MSNVIGLALSEQYGFNCIDLSRLLRGLSHGWLYGLSFNRGRGSDL